MVMDTEISVAVDFLLTFLHDLPAEKLEELAHELTEVLRERYTGHWYPDRPSKGNGYRCINVNQTVLDPTLAKAVRQCQLSTNSVSRSLPENLSLWVDPHEVSYRMGDRGPVDVLYTYQEDRHCTATYDMANWPLENYQNNGYEEFPDHPVQFHDYGHYDLSSAGSSDAEMDNSDGDYFTYRGEVFSRRVLTDYLDSTSSLNYTSSSAYLPSSSSVYTSSYSSPYQSYGSPHCVRKMQTLVH